MNEMDELTRMRASVPAPPVAGRAQAALMDAIRAEQTGMSAPDRAGRRASRLSRLHPALRWRAALAGAVAVAACAALAVTALHPGSTGSSTGPVRLTAWTVQHDPSGMIKVTIRDLRDAAGLQATLRGDGVPANVEFSPAYFEGTTSPSAIPPACSAPQMTDKDNATLQEKVTPGFGAPHSMEPGSVVLTIDPSAFPAGIGLYIKAFAASPGTENGPVLSLQTDLVTTSPQCTGS